MLRLACIRGAYSRVLAVGSYIILCGIAHCFALILIFDLGARFCRAQAYPPASRRFNSISSIVIYNESYDASNFSSLHFSHLDEEEQMQMREIADAKFKRTQDQP